MTGPKAQTTKAVAKREETGVAKLIQEYSGDLARIMPKSVEPETFMGLALSYIRRDVKLRDAAAKNPASLIFALRECAALGHMPMKGQFALTYRSDNKAPGGVTILGIEEYRGTIERMYRAGAVTAVKAEIVRENDPHFLWAPTRMNLPEHEFDALADDAERGPLRGVYAWAVMADGVTTSQCVVMGGGEVAKHRAKAATDKVWNAWPEPMWKKTALHALERYVPTSAEYRAELSRSISQMQRGKFESLPAPVLLQPSPDDVDDDVQDAEVVPDSQQRANDPT